MAAGCARGGEVAVTRQHVADTWDEGADVATMRGEADDTVLAGVEPGGSEVAVT